MGPALTKRYSNIFFTLGDTTNFTNAVVDILNKMRKDGKIDLMLQLPSHLERDRLSDAIVAHLRQNEGVTALTDKSPPDDIYQVFGVSKASYKKALGQLYKQRVISIDKNQIRLLDESIEELATRDR